MNCFIQVNNSFQRIHKLQEVAGSQAALNPVTLLPLLTLIQSGISARAEETHHVFLLKAKAELVSINTSVRKCLPDLESHCFTFLYLDPRYITLLPSKRARMISLLAWNLGFLPTCRRRLENRVERRVNFTTRFSGQKGTCSSPEPCLAPQDRTAGRCTSPCSQPSSDIPRDRRIYILFVFSASSTRKGGRVFLPPLPLNLKHLKKKVWRNPVFL